MSFGKRRMPSRPEQRRGMQRAKMMQELSDILKNCNIQVVRKNMQAIIGLASKNSYYHKRLRDALAQKGLSSIIVLKELATEALQA